MIKTKKKIIDGREIEVTQFPARKQIEYKFRLIQLLGAPLCQALSSFDVKKPLTQQNLDLESLSKGLISLFSSVSPSTIVDTLVLFFSSTRVNGKELNESFMDLEFAGELPTLYKIFFFVLEVNYDSFLGILRTLTSRTENLTQLQQS